MSVHKICTCDEVRWPKCPHPWYMDQFRWQGVAHHPNLTRYARLALHEDLTTKTRADELAEIVRTAIRAGTYVSAKTLRRSRPVVVAAQPVATLIARFDDEVIAADPNTRAMTKANRRANLDTFAAWRPNPKRPPVGEWPIDDVTTADIVAFRNSPAIVTRANSTWAKYRTVVAGFFGWAKAEGLATTNPFEVARTDQTRALRRGKAASRTQRISVADEAKLLWAAGRAHSDVAASRLQSIIIAAVETGMRRGELLALVWGDVDLDHRRIFVRAAEEGARKTGTARTLPISQRLYDELQTMRTDPAGARFGRAAYVFGNAVGGKLTKITKAWQTAILRANGVKVVWTKSALSSGCRAALKRINWHFHDLRHEAGCRWLESKVFDLEQIRQMYGHTTIAQTATYLHAAAQSAHLAMAQYDAQRAADRARVQVGANPPEGAPDAPNLHQNATRRARRASGPRLVRGNKLRGDV